MIPFAKTEAHGNDFLLVDEDDVAAADRGSLARAICDRLRGVGADGLILYRAAASLSMTLYNSDGSRAEFSGNGLRCLAAYLVYRGLASGGRIEIATGAGKKSLSLLGRSGIRFEFRANMGAPRAISKETLSIDGESLEATLVSLGNPHAVLFRGLADLRRIGPLAECHPRFPERTNVELVEIVSTSEIRMGVWERGAGETASSGTGSSAAAVASIWNGFVKSPVQVSCPGGVMSVEWAQGEDVFLTGKASIIAEGTYVAGRDLRHRDALTSK
jgi:diaminopimelate epimerase